MVKRIVSRRHFLAGMLGGTSSIATPSIIHAKEKRTWKMVMTWQKVLPGLGTGAVRLAKRITELSNGELEIKPYGGGELVPPLGVFDAVSEGVAEMGHSAAYYWLNKNRSTAFFAGAPGGMTAQEHNGWLKYGGGQELWDELYDNFNLKPFAAGNTGTQMGGWFKKPITSLEDIKGLKMRIPGLAGEVFTRLGGSSQTIPPQELFTAMQSGVIDGLEWVGPWNDMALGFHRVAEYYYGPAFHEGGPTLELMVNKQAFDALPDHLKEVIKVAAAEENDLMLAEFQANNVQALETLKQEHNVRVDTFPDDVLQRFFEISEEITKETAALGDINRRIYESYHKYRTLCIKASEVSEYGFMRARNKASA